MKVLIVLCALLSLSLAVPSHHGHRAHHKAAAHHPHLNVKKHHETHVDLPEHLKIAVKNRKQQRAEGECDTPECQVSANEFTENMDITADPCEDFNRFACGNYYDTHEPIDGSQGMFYDVDDLVTAQLDLILNSGARPGEAQPVTDSKIHYETCMDTDTIDSVGLTPMWNHLLMHGQNGWPIAMDSFDESTFDLYGTLSHVQSIGLSPLVGMGISSNFLNTSYNIMYIAEGGLGMSATFLLNPETYPTEIAAYTTYIAESAKLVRDYLGSSVTDAQIDAEATDIVTFEMAVAQIYNFIPHNRDEILEKVDIDYLQSITDSGVPDQFNWLTFLSEYVFGDTDIVITATEPIFIYGEPYFPDFSTLLSTTTSRTLANYVGWRFVMETNLATTYAMRNLTLDYENAVFGVTGFAPRDAHCRVQTQYDFGMQVSRAYMDDYFSDKTKAQVETLVELMRAAFQTLLDENTWMTAEDLVVAKEKLDSIIPRVAYPEWIMDNPKLDLAFQGLVINSGEQFDNLMRVGMFNNHWNLETFRGTPAIGWFLPPTVVNAFYDPLTNSISILAAIIQYPFYVQDSLAAVNYGGIGMVIGHEMTHGFDDTGRHFDKDGNLANWWSQESIDGFKNRSACFVDQYNGYIPPEFAGTEFDGISVDGQSTLGENIADNGGIREAFRAYSAYVDLFGSEQTLPGLPYTPEQLFFLGFANVWCERKTAASLNAQINGDPHSPGQFRIIGPLSNDEDFWTAWNCPAGSAMNRGADACLLW